MSSVFFGFFDFFLFVAIYAQNTLHPAIDTGFSVGNTPVPYYSDSGKKVHGLRAHRNAPAGRLHDSYNIKETAERVIGVAH